MLNFFSTELICEVPAGKIPELHYILQPPHLCVLLQKQHINSHFIYLPCWCQRTFVKNEYLISDISF